MRTIISSPVLLVLIISMLGSHGFSQGVIDSFAELQSQTLETTQQGKPEINDSRWIPDLK